MQMLNVSCVALFHKTKHMYINLIPHKRNQICQTIEHDTFELIV